MSHDGEEKAVEEKEPQTGTNAAGKGTNLSEQAIPRTLVMHWPTTELAESDSETFSTVSFVKMKRPFLNPFWRKRTQWAEVLYGTAIVHGNYGMDSDVGGSERPSHESKFIMNMINGSRFQKESSPVPF